MRRVLRAGADELLFLPLDPGDVTRALLKISEAAGAANITRAGVVVSVDEHGGRRGCHQPDGQPGARAAHELGKRVAVVDLDLQSGGLSVFLNLEPERTIMLLMSAEKKLDSIQLESALTKHDRASTCWPRPSGSRMRAGLRRAIGAVLDLMRQLFDFVIVDCGRISRELGGSLGTFRSPAVHARPNDSRDPLRLALHRLIRGWALNVEPSFVLSRHSLDHPITEEQITHTLARPIFANIPRDEKTLERVQLSGPGSLEDGAQLPLAHERRRAGPPLAGGRRLRQRRRPDGQDCFAPVLSDRGAHLEDNP